MIDSLMFGIPVDNNASVMKLSTEFLEFYLSKRIFPKTKVHKEISVFFCKENVPGVMGIRDDFLVYFFCKCRGTFAEKRRRSNMTNSHPCCT